MKPEFVSTNGVFYGLAPKSYCLTEYDSEGVPKVKKGAKGTQKYECKIFIFVQGVPRSVKLTEKAFRAALFDGQPFNVPINSLMLNANKEMVRISTIKRGLSDACTKVFVSEDTVSCSPLSLNGKFI